MREKDTSTQTHLSPQFCPSQVVSTGFRVLALHSRSHCKGECSRQTCAVQCERPRVGPCGRNDGVRVLSGPVWHGTLRQPVAAVRSGILRLELPQPRRVCPSHMCQVLGLEFPLHLWRQFLGHSFQIRDSSRQAEARGVLGGQLRGARPTRSMRGPVQDNQPMLWTAPRRVESLSLI